MGLRRQRRRPQPRTAEQIRDDHYLHWAAMLWAGGYAWQLHGFLVGIAVVVSLIGLISFTNLLLMSGGDFRLVRWNRWLWVLAAFVIIGLSGTSIETVPH